jgi:hypothetical protein
MKKTNAQIALDHLCEKAHHLLPEGAWNTLRDAIERDRVVAVLDGCSFETRVVRYYDGGPWECHLAWAGGGCMRQGSSPDAARDAAAKAIDNGEV